MNIPADWADSGFSGKPATVVWTVNGWVTSAVSAPNWNAYCWSFWSWYASPCGTSLTLRRFACPPAKTLSGLYRSE